MNKIIFISLIFAVGCSSSAKKKDVLVEEKKIELPKIEVSDRGPLFELSARPVFSKQTDKQTAKSVEIYKTKTHTFLRVGFDRVSRPVPNAAHILIPEIKAHFSGTFHKNNLFLRVVGVDPIPELFNITVEDTMYRFELAVSAKAKKGKKNFEKLFYSSLLAETLRSARSAYQISQVKSLRSLSGEFATLIASSDPIQRRNRANSQRARLMHLYSGATSIRETLQNDRHLRGLKNDKLTIDVNSLETVPLVQHPWSKMIESLDGDPVIEPMASYIPSDAAYFHFHDLRTFVKIAKELDGLSPIFQSLEGDGGTREFADYYEKQLVLERTGVAEILGHQAAKSVAIVMGDSFVKEGTDVGILFRIENKLLLETALNKFESSARAKHAKMNQFSVKVGDVDVRRIYTDDLSVNQFRASYGDVLVLTNSIELLNDLVNTYKKTRPSLKNEGDFRYMRTKYPFSTENESGFIFFSDAFVAKVISPQTRIGAVRRFARESELLSVNYGAMLYAKLEGALPKDRDSLIASGILSKSSFVHKDGSPISYSPSKGASSKYGSARMLRPLSAFPVTKVSASEAAAYKEFKETYQSYWQKFIDPIAIRIRHDEEKKTLAAEIRILPIIDSSEYDRLIELVGENIAPRYKKVNDGVEWTFAIGKDAKLRDELSATSKSMAGLSVSWVGDWMQIGAADHSRFWDLVVGVLGLPLKSTESGGKAFAGSRSLIKIAQEMPFHAAVQISNELVFAAMLTKLKSKADEAAPGMVTWQPLEEGYRDQYIVAVSGKDNYIGEFQIFYTIVNGIFVLSSRLDYLKTQIDKFLTDPEISAGQSNLAFDFKEGGWLTKAMETGIHATSFSDAHLEATDLMRDTIFSGKYNGEQTLNFRGVLPRSPFFGKVSFNTGEPKHEVTEALFNRDFSKMKSTISGQLENTKSMDGSISFDGKENHRSLLIKLEWKKR